MPVVDGQKSESEKFAGASTDLFDRGADGRRPRAAGRAPRTTSDRTSPRRFDIKFQARDKTLQHAWTTSWGVSTRLIGGVIMTHGDDSGLVLPPKIAPYQVVIVPIPRGNWKETVLPKRASDARSARGRRRARDARRSRTPYAGLEVRRVGTARRAARASRSDRRTSRRARCSRRAATRARRAALPMDGLVASRAGTARHDSKGAVRKGAEVPRRTHRRARDLRRVQTGHGRPPGYVVVALGARTNEAQVKAETQATIRNVPVLDAEARRQGLHVQRQASADVHGALRESPTSSSRPPPPSPRVFPSYFNPPHP